jgi:hypothetical protein
MLCQAVACTIWWHSSQQGAWFQACPVLNMTPLSTPRDMDIKSRLGIGGVRFVPERLLQTVAHGLKSKCGDGSRRRFNYQSCVQGVIHSLWLSRWPPSARCSCPAVLGQPCWRGGKATCQSNPSVFLCKLQPHRQHLPEQLEGFCHDGARV